MGKINITKLTILDRVVRLWFRFSFWWTSVYYNSNFEFTKTQDTALWRTFFSYGCEMDVNLVTESATCGNIKIKFDSDKDIRAIYLNNKIVYGTQTTICMLTKKLRKSIAEEKYNESERRISEDEFVESYIQSKGL